MSQANVERVSEQDLHAHTWKDNLSIPEKGDIVVFNAPSQLGNIGLFWTVLDPE